MLEHIRAAETAFIAKLLAVAVPSEHNMLTVTCMHHQTMLLGSLGVTVGCTCTEKVAHNTRAQLAFVPQLNEGLSRL